MAALLAFSAGTAATPVEAGMCAWCCSAVDRSRIRYSNLNSFGSDFNPRSWTRALCLKDSDGDGQPNGFELGDPCCDCTSWRALQLRQLPHSHVTCHYSSLARDTGLDPAIHQPDQQSGGFVEHIHTKLQRRVVQQRRCGKLSLLLPSFLPSHHSRLLVAPVM
jgi:hypothetical protein